MTTADSHLASPGSATWRDYYELGKPRVVALIVFTAVVGMFLAVPGLPPWQALLYGTLGIGLAASSAAAINHVVDRKFDEKMARTKNRPIPTGHVTTQQALTYAGIIGVASFFRGLPDIGRENRPAGRWEEDRYRMRLEDAVLAADKAALRALAAALADAKALGKGAFSRKADGRVHHFPSDLTG